jgi:hypothetical protein
MSEESEASSSESRASRGLSKIRMEGGQQSHDTEAGTAMILSSACYCQMKAGRARGDFIYTYDARCESDPVFSKIRAIGQFIFARYRTKNSAQTSMMRSKIGDFSQKRTVGERMISNVARLFSLRPVVFAGKPRPRQIWTDQQSDLRTVRQDVPFRYLRRTVDAGARVVIKGKAPHGFRANVSAVPLH